MRKKEHAFVRAFLAGFVLIFAMKVITRGLPVSGGLIASAFGVAIMWIYMATEKRSRPANEHPRLGDEAYYLGFLYTLTSLCAALVTLFLLDEWRPWFLAEGQLTLEQRTDEMVGSFGIALLTTIAGIVMRMTLQERGTVDQAMTIRIPHSGEHDEGESSPNEGESGSVAVDLERYAYELRRQLQNATNAFTAHTNQAILQARTVHTHMDEMMRTFHEGLEEKARTELEAVKTIYEDMATNAELVMERTDTQQVTVQRVLEKLEAQVRSMDDSIERIRVGSNETAENLGAIAAQSQASTQAFAEGEKAVSEGMSALAAAIAVQAKEKMDVQQRASETLQQLELINRAFSGLGQVARRTSSELTILPDRLQKASEAIEQLIEIGSIGNEIMNLKEQAKAVTERLVAVAVAGKRQEEALDATVIKLKALADITGEEVDAQNELRNSIAKIKEVAETVDRYGQSLKDSEREIRQINVGLKGLQNALGDEGIKLSKVLSEAIVAFDQVRRSDESTRSVLDRFFRR